MDDGGAALADLYVVGGDVLPKLVVLDEEGGEERVPVIGAAVVMVVGFVPALLELKASRRKLRGAILLREDGDALLLLPLTDGREGWKDV